MKNFLKSYLLESKCINLETGDYPGPFLTISRQAGCSAKRIAIKLSKILTGYSYMSETKTDVEWKWVDKDMFLGVVQEMIEEVKSGDYEDAEESIRFLKEVGRAFSDETIYDISDDKLIATLKGIICRLAHQGRTIIVGRSSGAILKDIPNKLNIRLEAPSDWRINRMMQIKDMTRSEAEKYINEADIKRDAFIEKIIGRTAENEDFDVIFNYASLEDDQIVDAVINILRNKKIISPHHDF
ncbi:cytidylate kinase-like family protein [Draconibacterium halophilum]|uniref:Cytidylate kinase-like family protein n=1 Tax=Draconibacterium halophilum TaxID=2706887 RepID=A0A6C0RCY3_9BACT|nr:cytidylate kinase-like family protein [Draconibacterium halophilum]QIA07917.1 cytidylate kinase-like family protein [Draconibacterium halophilum]